jgi:hypothetical protein
MKALIKTDETFIKDGQTINEHIPTNRIQKYLFIWSQEFLSSRNIQMLPEAEWLLK